MSIQHNSCFWAGTIVAAACPQLCYAQEAGKAEAAEQKIVAGTRVLADEGPANRTGFGPRRPSLELSTDEAGSKATFSIAASGVKAKPREGKDGFYNVNRQNFTFKAIVPIAKSEGSSPFSFGDLGQFEKIEFGFTSFHSSLGTGKGQNGGVDAKELLSQATMSCARAEARNFARGSNGGKYTQSMADDFVTLLASLEPRLTRQNILGNDQAELDQNQKPIPGQLETKFPEFTGHVKDKCYGPRDTVKFVEIHLGPKTAVDYRSTTFDDEPIKFWGLSGTVGQAKFKYVDAAAFTEQSKRKTGIDASAYAGLIGAKFNWSLRTKYSFQRKYEAAKEGQVCRPSTIAPGTQNCLTGPLGAPTKSKTSLLSVEYRRQFELLAGGGVPLAIAPQFTYDFDTKKYAVDVPVYLTANKEGKLTGGIRFGYRSDTKDLGAGIFLGVPFQLSF